jgi:AcrR family transcriptional regulator
MPPSTGLRARVRAELTGEIKDEARRQLAEEGAAALSLRAVTRALGMASSGIYRYFPSRDALLTALIIDAYDAVGLAAEQADAGMGRADTGGRWQAVSWAIRRWALDHPHEYALVYGSPVPGYRAPEDTVGPASRVTLVLARIVQDASEAGALRPAPTGAPPASPSGAAAAEARRLAETVFPSVGVEAVLRALGAWTQLFGMVSFELFGHFHGVIEDPTAVFERLVLEAGGFVGLPAPMSSGREDGPDRTVGSPRG